MSRFLKSFFLLIFISYNSLQAQLLNSTAWDMYNLSGAINFYLYFGTDTMYLSIDNITYTAKSLYQESSNSVQIIDLAGTGNCPAVEIGLYTFTIQNDTLVFVPVSDPCTSRFVILSSNYGVKMLNGVNEYNQLPEINIFPNPSFTGKFFISCENMPNYVCQLSVYTLDGRTIFGKESNSIFNHEIDLSNHPPGIYYLVLTYGNQRFHQKLTIY